MDLTVGSLLPLVALSPWITPLWLVALGGAIALAVLFAVALLLRLTVPKVAAIARTATKEALSQPLFYVLLAIGVFAIVIVFPILPYNTFGEDVKVLKDEGLTLIMVLSIGLALWTASNTITLEIEGRTALTLLSKPIGRRQFIIGKFLGTLGPVAILFIVLSIPFLTSVSYKVVYDARESSQPEPTTQQCFESMVQIIPGLILAFLETVVLTSICVAIATRLNMLANLVICASIYVLGHLVPALVQSSVRQIEFVAFVSQLLATVLPMLEHFNIYAAIATGREVPLGYLGVAALYCLLYSTVAMLLALLLFEDRDLA